MAKNDDCYEIYPFHTPLTRTVLNLCVVAVGILILFREFGIFAVLAYLLYLIFVVFYMTKVRCTRCYYHKRLCSTGFGKISSLYKKDSKHRFTEGQANNIFLAFVVLIPLILLLMRLILDFNWTRVYLLLILLVVVFVTLFEHLILGCTHCYERNHCITKSITRRIIK